MISVRLYARADFEKKLEPYKCKLVAKFDAGFELWETGWGEPFTLLPEQGEYFPEDQLRRFMILVAKTMPTDWNGGP